MWYRGLQSSWYVTSELEMTRLQRRFEKIADIGQSFEIVDANVHISNVDMNGILQWRSLVSYDEKFVI